MHRRTLILRSLAHYWRTHLGVIGGAALGAMVLTGALIVGDSVRHTLREQALKRIGQVDYALTTGERFFLSDLGERLASLPPLARFAPVLQVRGVASTTDGGRTALKVNVLGVDERFFELAPNPGGVALTAPGQGRINRRLAEQLGVGAGRPNPRKSRCAAAS